MFIIRSFVDKIMQKCLSHYFGLRSRTVVGYFNGGKLEAAAVVPDDVVEGHFAVFAIKGEETERFIVELDNLNDPAFLGLLELAKEEYGFKQKGALAVPCRPQELQKILDEWRHHI
ncbi:hypothetical protein L6164_009754 [Bauhinia variegata]|uniref:Uncharacterized protein n=1 Tax=Bauhinia variegata TaxID=167791 RepID=A0ACB9PL43_BAUVA|nr:hypothetical protein L6164_009754 [Bauhinia variegata]